MSILHWIKNHKLVLLCILIILYLLRTSSASPMALRTNSIGISDQTFTTASAPFEKSLAPQAGINSVNYQQTSTSSERVVIKESNLSLLVKNVRETTEKIINTAKGMGGYMVSVSVSNPQEQAFATVTIRVPSNRMDEALNQFRNNAIKVTDENLTGTDVTDEYQDLDQRLATLKATKTKFEDILKKAITVDEILRVNQEIINLEAQIDQTTGQKMALADSAKLTKITLFLSTDELALPYTPDKTFRPSVVFKLAIRSLLSSLQGLSEFLIWIGVYAVLWIPLVLIILFVRKKFRSSKPKSNPPSQGK